MFDSFDVLAVRSDYWPALGGAVLLLGALTVIALRSAGSAKLVLLTLVTLFGLRIVLVDNPLSWSLYAQRLDSDLVGWRQYSLVRIVRGSYFEVERPRVLAVGSSQTDAVFGAYAAKHAELDTFGVAAMMPFDFVLYADEIFRRRPDTIVLYLSDFDIAKEPTPEAMVLVPRQGLDMLSIARRVRVLSPGGEYDRAVTELLVGEILPEFKYRYVFRGLVERELRRFSRRIGRRGAAAETERATLEERIGWLRDSLDAQHIEFNIYWLKEFLREAERNDVGVVIAEGHYSALVDNEETKSLSAHVRTLLATAAGEFSHVRFLARTEIYQFSPEEYTDLTHVSLEAGERFTRAALERLEAQ